MQKYLRQYLLNLLQTYKTAVTRANIFAWVGQILIIFIAIYPQAEQHVTIFRLIMNHPKHLLHVSNIGQSHLSVCCLHLQSVTLSWFHFLPDIRLFMPFKTPAPIFRSSPALEVGMPVWRANCCFSFVMMLFWVQPINFLLIFAPTSKTFTIFVPEKGTEAGFMTAENLSGGCRIKSYRKKESICYYFALSQKA